LAGGAGYCPDPVQVISYWHDYRHESTKDTQGNHVDARGSNIMLRRCFIAVLFCVSAGCAAQPWQKVSLTAPAYDNETQDFGVQPTTIIRTGDFDAPTPTRIVGATTITTPQLRDMMLASPPPMLIDVLGGNQTVSLPGALWLRGAGLGNSLHDQTQEKLGMRLSELAGGNKARAIVFFCLSKTCWLSHNAAVRAVALGYSNVYWYRGGRNAWQAAGLAMEPVAANNF
jgi:PQQ-dependent catabolism-associated CXXCW motif protein